MTMLLTSRSMQCQKSTTWALIIALTLSVTMAVTSFATQKNLQKKTGSSEYSEDPADSKNNFSVLPLQSRILMRDVIYKHYSRADLERIVANQTALLINAPSEPASLIVRGFAQWKLERYLGAQVDLEKALHIFPKIDDFNFYLVLGECHLQRVEVTKAIECFSKMIQLKPRNLMGYLRRCQSLVDSKQYSKALPDANKVVELSKREGWALELRARVNRLTGHYTEAVNDCTEALKSTPNDFALYDERSKSYEKLGKKELAEKDKKEWNKFSRETLIDTLGE
jgi:tetratricopeptide (TPR) repeat protein